MKKMIILFFLLFITSCSLGETNEMKKAKETMLQDTKNNQNISQDEEVVSQEISGEKLESYSQIHYELGEDILVINDVGDVENIQETFDITGKILNTEVDKITVSFENPTSSFPKDERYNLQTYKSGADTFLYRAYKKYQVLDEGQNIYTIEAFIGDQVVAKAQLELFIASPKIAETLPNILETSLSGTQIVEDRENFSLFPLTSSGMNCENLGDYLTNTYSWYYWNTCRPLVENESFAFNLLRLDGEKYVYEKHFVDSVKKIYGIQLLETGTGVTREQLPEKNQFLRGEVYPQEETAQNYFKNYNPN